MDVATSHALTYSIVILVVVASLLYSTRPTEGPEASSINPEEIGMSALNALKSYGFRIGLIAPYGLILIPPLIDLYDREFKYSLVSVIGVASAIIGYAFQYAIKGGGSFLPALTVGTTAMISFILNDAWMQKGYTRYTIFATLIGGLLIFFQALNNPPSHVFESPLMNDGVAVLLGAGLGLLGWMISWNTYREFLPHTCIIHLKSAS